MEEVNHLPVGYILKEFRIEKILGVGGFGVTYLAIDINLNTKVVIKEFLPKEFSTRKKNSQTIISYSEFNNDGVYEYLLKKFIDEAKILASIKHPNIVRVVNFFKENNTAYFVMDYIEGESLNEYLKRKIFLEEEEILSIIIPILEGVKKLHTQKYLHRDIAPDNIYLRKNGMPMLIDFGSAKNYSTHKSISLVAIIKAGYSAPEQYTIDAEPTPATDIYAVGSVLYSMISGKRTPEATLRQISLLNDEADPLGNIESIYKSKYSKELLFSIKKSMNVKVVDRFQEVSDFQQSLLSNHSNKKDRKQKIVKKIVLFIVMTIVVFGGYFLTKKYLSIYPKLNSKSLETMALASLIQD